MRSEAQQMYEAAGLVLDSERRRSVRALIDALFFYVPARDSFVLRDPDVSEYGSEQLRRMAGL